MGAGNGNDDVDRDTLQSTNPVNPSIEPVNGGSDNGAGWNAGLEQQDVDSNPSLERSTNGVFGAAQTSTWNNPYTSEVDLKVDEVRRDMNV